VQEDYFDIIDSNEKAYWLGFFAADGSIGKNTNVSFYLSAKDTDHLKKFRDVVAPRAEIKSSPGYPNSVWLHLSSRHMADTLKGYGMSPVNKERALRWPTSVSDEFGIPFVAGFFDGDGSLSWVSRDRLWSWSLAGCRSMLEQVREFLITKTNLDLPEVAGISKNGFSGRFATVGSKAVILDSLLETSGIGMERKRIATHGGPYESAR
jgi:hypothetical protein